MTLADNRDASRYELPGEAGLGFVDYRLDETQGRIVLIHAEVPPAAKGRGAGRALVEAVLADIRLRGLKVVPKCGFVAAVMHRDPAWHDLLAD